MILYGDETDVTGRVGYRIWHPPSLDGANLFLSNFHRQPVAAEEHLHDCLEVVWIRKGRAFVAAQDKLFMLEAGDVCVVTPEVAHIGSPVADADCTYALIHLSPRLLQSCLGNDAGSFNRMRAGATIWRARDASVSDVMCKAFESLSAPLAEESAKSILRALLNDLAEVPSKADDQLSRPPPHRSVEQAKQIIAKSCFDCLTLDELSTEVGLNKRYLISLFTRRVGLPPKKFQIAMRIDVARQLIQDGSQSLGAIAQTLGFADQSHLTRNFKRQYGVAPGSFRSRCIA